MKFSIAHSGITVTCFGANKKELLKDIDEARVFVADQVRVNLIAPRKKKRVVKKKVEPKPEKEIGKSDGGQTPTSDFQAKIINE